MRMVFLVQKAAWFVEYQQAWYRFADMNEVKLGLSGLALNMVNQHDLIEQPHHAGTAHVLQADERTLRIRLEGPDKVQIDSIDILKSFIHQKHSRSRGDGQACHRHGEG